MYLFIAYAEAKVVTATVTVTVAAAIMIEFIILNSFLNNNNKVYIK